MKMKEPQELAEEHWKFLEKWLHQIFVDGFINMAKKKR
jgi:hypothetical protein